MQLKGVDSLIADCNIVHCSFGDLGHISGEKLTIKTVSVCVVFLCIAHTRKRVVLDLHGIYCMSTINAKQQLMGLKGTYVCYMNV